MRESGAQSPSRGSASPPEWQGPQDGGRRRQHQEPPKDEIYPGPLSARTPPSPQSGAREAPRSALTVNVTLWGWALPLPETLPAPSSTPRAPRLPPQAPRQPPRALVCPLCPCLPSLLPCRASTRDEDNFPVRPKVSRGHPSPALTEPCPPKGSICASTPRRRPLLWPLSTAAPAWALLQGGGRRPTWREPSHICPHQHPPGAHSSFLLVVLTLTLTPNPNPNPNPRLMAPAPTTPHAAVSFLYFFPSGGPSVWVPTRVKMSFICTAQSGSHQPPRLL